MKHTKTQPTVLTCFKAYDVRGELGVNFNATVAYRIGRAAAEHFQATNIVIGFDARETSPELAAAVMRGICDAGSNVFSLGLAGTEEMYWAVTEFNACAGIEITASHNPINYNGMKIVKSGSRPLDDKDDFQAIKLLAENETWVENLSKGSIQDISKEARKNYVQRVLSFLNHNNLKPLKIIVNSGNGAAGPTFDAIADELGRIGSPLEFIRAGIDTLIFVTGRNKRAIEDHFDANLELEAALRAKGKHEQADMVHNILPSGVECIFVRQAEQLGLGHAVLCAERVVGNEPFAVLLADDFLTQQSASAKSNVTKDLKNAFETTGQTQLSVMRVAGADISKYGVIVHGDTQGAVAGLVEKPSVEEAPSDMASIGRYILTPDIFDVLRDLPAGGGGEIQLADAINIQAKRGTVNAVHSTALRFDCGSVDGFLAAISHVSKLRSS